MPIVPFSGPSAAKGALVPISSVSLGSAGGAVFTNIPQTYQDLMMVLSTRDTNNASTPVLFNYINSDSSALYSFTTLTGDGSSVSSGKVTGTNSFGTALQNGAYSAPDIFSTNIYHFLSYTNTSTFKSVLIRSSADINGAGGTRLSAGLYRSTSAITNIWVNPATAFAPGSTATLYGIRSVTQ